VSGASDECCVQSPAAACVSAAVLVEASWCTLPTTLIRSVRLSPRTHLSVSFIARQCMLSAILLWHFSVCLSECPSNAGIVIVEWTYRQTFWLSRRSHHSSSSEPHRRHKIPREPISGAICNITIYLENGTRWAQLISNTNRKS